ncbi:MAG: hypothetical protein OK456_00155 [Thaumarchaeota archaeon]|nr:hypothetical protein [Nitrososphaerota archaeon]
METNQAVLAGKTGIGRKHIVGALLTFALLAVAVATYGGILSARGSTTAPPLETVQVSVVTTYGIADYQYSVSAYNSTGGLVASYQSQYAAAAFELPAGTYIFAATADQQAGYYYPIAMSDGVSTTSTSASSAGSAAIICCMASSPSGKATACCGGSPQVEYGYVRQQVSGQASLTIDTKPINQTSVSTLTLRVNYPNGTAASGVYLYGSVLGDEYGWAYGGNAVSLSNTTDQTGTATLTVPDAPILVSADASIPITLPLNQTTIQVTVAGEKVNVTAYWQPNYVSFAAQALIVPPQNSATLTLQYQPQSVGPIPLEASTQTQTAVASPPLASVQSNSPSQTSSQAAVAADPATSTGGQASTGSGGLLISLGAVAMAAVAIGVALFAVRSRSVPTAN